MNATPWLGANYIRDNLVLLFAFSMLAPWGDGVLWQHSPPLQLGSSVPTSQICNAHDSVGLTQNLLCSHLTVTHCEAEVSGLIRSLIIKKTTVTHANGFAKNYLICNSAGQFVHPGTGLCNLLGGVDHI